MNNYKQYLEWISIHALREEGDAQRHRELRGCGISIHALREEGDARSSRKERRSVRHFYPRPPRGGRREAVKYDLLREKFLSTPSARRATEKGLPVVALFGISIHALREEGDSMLEAISEPVVLFLSTPSARRATELYPGQPRQPDRFLSTPSARRATPGQTPGMSRPLHFYPRPPRGGRPYMPEVFHDVMKFLSTPSARRATGGARQKDRLSQFLSTPSARRATLEFLVVVGARTDFYPRPPRGGRRFPVRSSKAGKNFYPRPPRGGRPNQRLFWHPPHHNFYPRPPRGGRPEPANWMSKLAVFLSTPSARRATHPAVGHPFLGTISIHALREEGDSLTALGAFR